MRCSRTRWNSIWKPMWRAKYRTVGMFTAEATRKQLATAIDVTVTEGPACTRVVTRRLRGSPGESVVCT